MIKSVAKHSYIKGRNGIARGRAHINYISHRDGPDREKGGRKFFDREREDIGASEVKKLMYERADSRGVTMHKLILSPGVNTDAKEYTRELMERLEREKGQTFEWRAVVHENTNHQHVHLVVMGKDADGHLVRIGKEEHTKLRQFGDEYLDREHKLDRYLDRELHDLTRSRDYDRGIDREVRRLIFGNRDEKERTLDAERHRRDFEELDRKFREAFESKKTPDLYPVRGRERIFEEAGRLAEHHGDYTRAVERERLSTMLKESPQLAESIQSDLSALKEAAHENRAHEGRDVELERILGVDTSSRERSKEAEQQGMSQEAVAESFETDRIAKPEKQDSERELEREKDDEQGSDA